MKSCFIFVVNVFLICSCTVIQKQVPNQAEKWEPDTLRTYRYYEKIEEMIIQNNDYSLMGNVVYNETSYPIYCIKIDNNSKKDVIISSGVHGNEPAGVAANFELIKILQTNKELKKYNYYIVPVVNPWGWEKATRYNYDGMDINRDFSTNNHNTQEAEIFTDYFKDLKPFAAIDLHESRSTGNFYFVYTRNMKRLMVDFINENNDKYIFENDLKYIVTTAKSGIIYLNRFIIFIGKMTDRRALSNFFLYHTELVTTIESSVNYDIENRINFQVQSVLQILNNYGN